MRWIPTVILWLGLLAAVPAADPIREVLRADPPPYYDVTHDTWQPVELRVPPSPDLADEEPMTPAMSPFITRAFVAALALLGAILVLWVLRRLRWRHRSAAMATGAGAPVMGGCEVLTGAGRIARDPAAGLMDAITNGDWDRAVINLYACQLQQCERLHLLRLAAGVTNHAYLAELRRAPAPTFTVLQATIAAFEAVYFGGRHLTRAQCEPLLAADAAWRGSVEVPA